MKRVLTIGPFDSSGETGIQADLRVFDSLEVTGLCAVTSLRASDGRDIRRVFHAPPRVVEAQIDAVAGRAVDATKVAALHDRTLVDAVAERVRRRRLGPVVLDAGIVDARGERLLGRDGVDWLRRRLLPQVALVLLRPVEVEILTGAVIEDAAALPEALERVRRAGAAAVLLLGADAGGEGDWLGDSEGARPLGATLPKEGGARDRFSAALAVRLALGDAPADAVTFAARFAENG